MGTRLRRTELQFQLDQQTHTLPVARCGGRYPQSYLLSVTRVSLERASIHGILVHSHSAPIPIPHSSHPTQSAALSLLCNKEFWEHCYFFSAGTSSSSFHHSLLHALTRIDLRFISALCTFPSCCADQRDRLRPTRSLLATHPLAATLTLETLLTDHGLEQES